MAGETREISAFIELSGPMVPFSCFATGTYPNADLDSDPDSDQGLKQQAADVFCVPRKHLTAGNAVSTI